MGHNTSVSGDHDRLEVHARQRALMALEPCDEHFQGPPRHLPRTDGRRYLLSGMAMCEVRRTIAAEILECLGKPGHDGLAQESREWVAARAAIAADRALARVGVGRAL